MATPTRTQVKHFKKYLGTGNVAGAANGVNTDVTGALISNVPPGSYILTYGGIGNVAYSVAPTSSQASFGVNFNGVDTTSIANVYVGNIPGNALARGHQMKIMPITITVTTSFQLYVNVFTSGGTITSRGGIEAFIQLEQVAVP